MIIGGVGVGLVIPSRRRRGGEQAGAAGREHRGRWGDALRLTGSAWLRRSRAALRFMCSVRWRLVLMVRRTRVVPCFASLIRTLPRGPRSTPRRWPFTNTVTRRTREARTPLMRMVARVRALHMPGILAAAPGHEAPLTAIVARSTMSREERPTATG